MPPLFCLSDCSIIQGGIYPSPTVFFHIFLKPCGEKIGLINYPAMPGGCSDGGKTSGRDSFFRILEFYITGQSEKLLSLTNVHESSILKK